MSTAIFMMNTISTSITQMSLWASHIVICTGTSRSCIATLTIPIYIIAIVICDMSYFRFPENIDAGSRIMLPFAANCPIATCSAT